VLRRTNPMNDQSAAARRGSVDREARPTRRNVSAAIKPHLNPPIHAKRQIPAPARPRSELRPAETQLALVMASETSLRVCVLTGCSDGWSYGQSHEHLPGAGVPRFGGRVPLLTQLRWHPCPIRRPRRDPARSRTPVPRPRCWMVTNDRPDRTGGHRRSAALAPVCTPAAAVRSSNADNARGPHQHALAVLVALLDRLADGQLAVEACETARHPTRLSSSPAVTSRPARAISAT